MSSCIGTTTRLPWVTAFGGRNISRCFRYPSSSLTLVSCEPLEQIVHTNLIKALYTLLAWPTILAPINPGFRTGALVVSGRQSLQLSRAVRYSRHTLFCSLCFTYQPTRSHLRRKLCEKRAKSRSLLSKRQLTKPQMLWYQLAMLLLSLPKGWEDWALLRIRVISAEDRMRHQDFP